MVEQSARFTRAPLSGQRALAAWRGLLAWAEVAPPLPGGAKDVTDFWRKQGDLDEWIKQCADTP